jgi:dihydrodipicolinate synthase/N-acetylneuraminate lyase
VNLQPAVTLQLAEHPNVMGIKEASGDLAQVMQILRGRPERFTVLSGDDWLTLAIVAAGGGGGRGGAAPPRPPPPPPPAPCDVVITLADFVTPRRAGD